MLNENGLRFLDEGVDFRNYTYAQFGQAILKEPGKRAWQIFDSKVFDLLYSEYEFSDAHYEEADSLAELFQKCDGLDSLTAMKTLQEFNRNVAKVINFDPTVLDGLSSHSSGVNKSNWAQKIDTGPFRAYPVTGGITFTYGGLKVSQKAEVLDTQDKPIKGLFACGEIVGGVFYGGYPGGSGLTSGAVFGRLAGSSAANF